MLCKANGIKSTSDFFKYLIEYELLFFKDKKYHLTDKGKLFGGRYRTNGQGERWVVWSSDDLHTVLCNFKRPLFDRLNINYLMHITHTANLPGILSKGLLPHNNKAQKVDISNSLVNARRAKKEPIHKHSIHDYVPFYFNVRNAMLFQVQKEFGAEAKSLKLFFKTHFIIKNKIDVIHAHFGPNGADAVVFKKLGLPIKHFVASTNVNDTVPNYLKDGVYKPKPSTATISNAMDVGNPSNFIRIQELFNNDLESLKKAFSSYSFTDDETRETMKMIYNNSGYVADPHGAVGYLGLKKHGLKENEFGVFLETAHPVKFLDIVEETLPVKVEIPEQIKKVIDNKKVAIKASSYEDLKGFLMK